MPSKYLFLNSEQLTNVDSVATWNNLPVLSESRRECYINVAHACAVFSTALSNREALLKINLPSVNYFSSSNNAPVMEYLQSDDNLVFEAVYESPIKLLTNDALKKIEIQLTDNAGDVIDLDDLESLTVVLKLDYIDQAAMANEYLSQMPSLLR
jgi:hypothetical protein